MSKMEEIYTCEAVIKASTLKAVLIELDEENYWLPRSQLIDDDELPEKGHAQIKMTAWIAKEKGLI